MNELSWIITGIAVLSPLVTALINGIFQLKLRMIDRREELRKQTVLHEKEILENALASLGERSSYTVNQTLQTSGAALFLATSYLDSDISDLIIKIATSVYNDYDISDEDVTTVQRSIKAKIIEISNKY